MRVPAITLNNFTNINQNKKKINQNTYFLHSYINSLSSVYYVPFTSIANSAKLRTLFHYGLPCMYSGIEMIDPKMVTKMLKNNTFRQPASRVIEVLTPYEKSITGTEAKVFEIIKEAAQNSPDKNLHELMQEIAPRFKKRLRKKQNPIFEELTEASHKLPDKYRYKFKQFMDNTNKKLNDEPVIVPFSSYEFKYKLEKIKADIQKGEDIKAIKVMDKLIKEANKFTNSTTANTIGRQKNTLSFLYKIFKHSVLKENTALNNLFNTSKSRLNKESTVIPFNRKSFIYDLSKLIQDIPDQQLQEKMISIAQKLPTSKESTSAYILKVLPDSSEKIGYRLLWPSIASVEHIYPKSCGGPDLMYNFGGACCRENTERQNIDFMKQLKRCPQTKENCQKYIDKLIELANSGVFAKHNINVKYILDFKNTIYRQSRKTLNLDISKLKPELLNINNCKKNA
ncbi:unknown [Fusobacterium sp. CAG:439]|nr:unknown [Fusobacterium sp. CAG:439]